MPPKRKHLKPRVLVLRIPVKTVVKTLTRLALMIVLVVLFVRVIHGVRELSAAVVGTKFMEIVTDVLADRLFPHIGEDV